MAADTRTRSGSKALLMVGVLLVAANLRPVITAVGPVLDQIGGDTGLGAAALGLLAAVPLLAFAAVSPLTHALSVRFGVERTVFAALLVLAAGTLLRPLPGVANLWVGTFVLGSAIAVCNVLLPAIIKRDFPDRMAQLTGAYSAVLGGVASLGAGLSVPLSQLPIGPDGGPAGWRFALAAYVVVGIPALVVWLPRLRGPGAVTAAPAMEHPNARGAATTATAPSRAPGGRQTVWRSPLAWQVTLYMGTQSMVFFILISWLPTVERSYGRSDIGSGWDLMGFQLIGVLASLLTPRLMRGRLSHIAPALPPVLTAAGIVGLMMAPGAMLFWVLVIGFGCGSSLVLALSLFGLRARTHQQASALSGMAQSLGYLLAAAGPPLFGALYGWTGDWLWPLAVVLAASAGQAWTGLLVGRDRYVFG